MLTVIVVVALCGVGGGYTIGRSALFQPSRDRHERARDIFDAAANSVIEQLDPPYGVIAADLDILPSVPAVADAKTRRWLLRRWKWHYLWACNICTGWWWCAAALAFWSGVAWLTGEPAPVGWSTAGPVLGAACAAHTVITGAGNKLEIW